MVWGVCQGVNVSDPQFVKSYLSRRDTARWLEQMYAYDQVANDPVGRAILLAESVLPDVHAPVITTFVKDDACHDRLGKLKRELEAAIEQVPDRHDLFHVVAYLLAWCHSRCDRDLSRADRVIAVSERLVETAESDDVRLLPVLARGAWHVEQTDYHAAYQIYCSKLNAESGTVLWWRLMRGRIDCALRNGFFQDAHDLLNGVEAHFDQAALHNKAFYLTARVRHGLCVSRPQESGCYLEKLEALIGDSDPVRVGSWRVHHLIQNEALEEAKQEIDALETDKGPDPLTVLCLRAAWLKASGEYVRSRQTLERALKIARTRSVYHNLSILGMMARMNLVLGEAERARRILLRLDPHRNQPRWNIEWMCVCILEGDFKAAAEHYRRFRSYESDGQLQTNLQSIPTITGFHIEKLKRIISEPEAEGPSGRRRETAPHAPHSQTLIGESPQIRSVRQQVERFAPLDSPVLVIGETGTGKEIVARQLHHHSPVRSEPFVAVNCGGLSDTLIESELFGHVRGAFTGAVGDHPGLFKAAGHGTIFLDEINSMSLRLQASLLRVLEQKEIRPVGSNRLHKIQCRIVAATNQDLEEAIREGRFRQDLYYRLSGLSITIAPLRSRIEDLDVLIDHFLGCMPGGSHLEVAPELVRKLKHHTWPGNVRELKNEIERMCLLAGGESMLTEEMFAEQSKPGRVEPASSPNGNSGELDLSGVNLRNALARRQVIRKLFKRHTSLTRAKLVSILGSAPNTITKDLSCLEQDGFIRRIHTSGHLRTSYFELTGQHD